MCRGSGYPVRIISSLSVVEWRIASCLSYLALISASIQVQGTDFDSISIVNMLVHHIRHFANFYSCLPNSLRSGKLQLVWCYFSVWLKSPHWFVHKLNMWKKCMMTRHLIEFLVEILNNIQDMQQYNLRPFWNLLKYAWFLICLKIGSVTCSDIEFDTSGSLYKNEHSYHFFTYWFADYSFGHFRHLNQMWQYFRCPYGAVNSWWQSQAATSRAEMWSHWKSAIKFL